MRASNPRRREEDSARGLSSCWGVLISRVCWLPVSHREAGGRLSGVGGGRCDETSVIQLCERKRSQCPMMIKLYHMCHMPSCYSCIHPVGGFERLERLGLGPVPRAPRAHTRTNINKHGGMTEKS